MLPASKHKFCEQKVGACGGGVALDTSSMELTIINNTNLEKNFKFIVGTPHNLEPPGRHIY